MNSNNNIRSKLSSENNLKHLSRNPYSFNSSDHINFSRTSSNYRIHNASQKDLTSNSQLNPQNNNNKSNKNLDNSPIFTNNNILYNSNSNSNLNQNNNIANNNNLNNNFQNSIHDTLFIQSKPAYEFYGYAFYLVSFVAMFLWLVWAFFSEYINNLGFTYYPNRYWAVAIPDYIIICILFYVVIFLCYNFIHTPSFDSLNTVTDKYSNLMKSVNYSRLEEDNDIPDLQDIPISIVNAYLYSDSFNQQNEQYSTYSPS